MRSVFLSVCVACLLAPLAATAAQSPSFTAADVVAERSVSDPVISPDGNWVAYLTRVNDTTEDAQNADLWMASWDGARNIRLTRTAESESHPRWSPDGRYLAV